MMNKIRISAKKSLGQNFLVNPGIVQKIILAADIKKDDVVLEIGPGTGTLTESLVQTGARIVCIEKDARLIGPLREKFPDLEIIEGDIMELEIEKLKLGNYKIVSNIPYYLTSHLIRLMLEKWPRPILAVLMVQEEVARRMIAMPPDMNLLALSVQLYAKPSIIVRVSRNSFRPVPDVDSAVIKIETRDMSMSDRELNERILDMARKAFGQKRKQLSATIPLEVLKKADIDHKIRPQELSIDEWLRLANSLL